MKDCCIYQTFDDLDDFLNSVYGWDAQFKQLGSGPYYSESIQYSLDNTHYASNRIHQHVEIEGMPPNQLLTISIPAVPHLRMTWYGISIPADSVLLRQPHREMDCVVWSDFNLYHISMPKEQLIELCIELGYPSLPKRIEQSEIIRCDPKALSEIRRMVSVFNNVLRSPLHDMESWIREQISYTIPIKLIHTLASATNITKKRSEHNRFKIVREVKQFLDMLPEDIKPGIVELCVELDVSQRSLEYAFKEYFGVTPERYLIFSRLNQVRKVLRKQHLLDTKISDIANRFGFWHMGQFAADYRKLFGELPSQTNSKNTERLFKNSN